MGRAVQRVKAVVIAHGEVHETIARSSTVPLLSSPRTAQAGHWIAGVFSRI